MAKIAIAIIEHDHKILMARRREREGSLHWQFPGGAVEDGETDFQAVERELLEEVNIVCEAIEKLGERVHPVTGRVVSYIRCKYKSGDPVVKDTDELDMVSWLTPAEVFERVTSGLFSPVQTFIENLQKG